MESAHTQRGPLIIYGLLALFWFGVAMSLLTTFLLLFPGTSLDIVWRIKPEAKDDLARFGSAATALMVMLAVACASAAIGLTRRAEWGRRTAIAVLSTNLLGDCINAVARADWRTLIGLPIAAALIWYLLSTSGRGISSTRATSIRCQLSTIECLLKRKEWAEHPDDEPESEPDWLSFNKAKSGGKEQQSLIRRRDREPCRNGGPSFESRRSLSIKGRGVHKAPYHY